MFRRPFRRRFPIVRPRPVIMPMAAGPRQALQNAHRQMEHGEYLSAADTFQRLAEAAETRGLMRHAPFLFLQAAHARTLAGQLEAGIPLMRKGLRLLAEEGRWLALQKAAQKAIAQLKQAGKSDVASEIQAWLEQTIQHHPEASMELPDDFTSRKPSIPPKCPFCGATLRSDEVEWIDEISVECPFCGSSVPAR